MLNIFGSAKKFRLARESLQLHFSFFAANLPLRPTSFASASACMGIDEEAPFRFGGEETNFDIINQKLSFLVRIVLN